MYEYRPRLQFLRQRLQLLQFQLYMARLSIVYSGRIKWFSIFDALNLACGIYLWCSFEPNVINKD